MSKEKQIEAMAFDLCLIDTCKHLTQAECNNTTCAHCEAEALYNAGYRKQSEWISVDERWPETDGYYLVWNKEQRKIEIRFFHRLPPHYPVETYPEIRAYFGNCSDHKSITHWMPLPEPPVMKGK
jgi:hypothetical protein